MVQRHHRRPIGIQQKINPMNADPAEGNRGHNPTLDHLVGQIRRGPMRDRAMALFERFTGHRHNLAMLSRN